MGYLAFYAGSYDEAIAELKKGDQKDPFLLGLIALAHEKKGDVAMAREYFGRVIGSNAHGLQSALMRPIARQRTLQKAAGSSTRQ